MTCQDAAHAGYAMEAASSTPLSSSSRRRKGQPRKCVDSTLALTESSTSVSSVASNDSGLHSSSSLSLSDVTPTTSFSSVLPEVLIQSLVGSSDGIFQQLKQFEGGDELTSFMTVHPPPTTTSSPVLPIQKSGSVVFPANGKNGVKMEACLPERFQRILNDANGSSDSPGYSNGVEVLQRKRKEPGRCETKATLQAADGTILEGNYDAEELQSFVKNFKLLRNKHGFTQGDVGMALGRRYGADFSQTTISRFEALNLSFKNMCKLRPLLEEWLDEVEKAVERGVVPTDLLLCDSSPPAFADGSGQASGSTSPELRLQPVHAPRLNAKIVPPLKKRRKRTNLDAMQKTALDAFFVRNTRPDYSQIQEIADSLGLDNDVVRVWFCNRRQKVRKTE